MTAADYDRQVADISAAYDRSRRQLAAGIAAARRYDPTAHEVPGGTRRAVIRCRGRAAREAVADVAPDVAVTS